MKPLLKTEFITKSGEKGCIITQKRKDGNFITTFRPSLGLNFHSIDQDMQKSHETVKSFVKDIKECTLQLSSYAD